MFELSFLNSKYGDDAKKIIDFQTKLENDFFKEKLLLKTSQEIANVVVGLKFDVFSVCASLVIPFVESGLFDINLIEEKETKTLISKIISNEQILKNYSDAEGLKEMLIGISKDIRVIVIKTAQMLIYARQNVAKINDLKVRENFKLIDDIYAPIAARLGLSEIKSELQDLSFEFHEPEVFAKLKQDVKDETRANLAMVSGIVSKVKEILGKNGIECTCYGRIKHLSSINNKLKSKNLTLKNIYDISAIRILVKSVQECYSALGIVHANFVPVDGRFKDYIASPKPNGYKSLHTTVYFHDEFFEVQIRTYDMHEFAEYGVAAHFLYKENKKGLAGLDNKLLWIRRLLENKENVSADKLLEELKTDVYLGEIFVQTPLGKVIKLVEGATPVDFAYAIHSDVGHKCVGAKVNGVMVPLSTALENSDVVEILTSQVAKGPSRDWLKIAKMQSTKEKINYYFKKQMKDENIKLGKSIVEQYAKNNDIQLSSLLVEKYVSVVLKKNAFLSVDELYASIGYGSITAEKFVRRLQSLKLADEQKQTTIFDTISKAPVKLDSKSDIDGIEGSLTKYCKCCNPIPGDDIVGYVSRGRGIIIHKKDCENIEKLSSSRFVDVKWNTKGKDNLFSSFVDIVAKNNSSVYVDITNALSELGVKVVSLNSNENKKGELILKIGVLIKDRDMLQKVKNKLASLSSVFEAK